MPQIDLPIAAPLDDELLEIITQAPLPGLDAEPRCSATAERVAEWIKEQRCEASSTSAALWLLAGELERSHFVSQTLASSDGSWWHGMMHRREGDFSNAKYWFRKANGHPVVAQLAAVIESRRLELVAITEPFASFPFEQPPVPNERLLDALTDGIERTTVRSPGQANLFQRIAWWEWQLLFHHGR